MTKILAIVASIALALLTGSTAPRADDAVPRVALVIGNAAYADADAPVKEALSDAHAVADELKHDGFAVTSADNLNRATMQSLFDTFYATIKPRALVVVFFSGYGIQSGRQTFI